MGAGSYLEVTGMLWNRGGVCITSRMYQMPLIVHFKKVNFMLCEFHFKKLLKTKPNDLALPLPGCVTLGNLPNFSGPQHPFPIGGRGTISLTDGTKDVGEVC